MAGPPFAGSTMLPVPIGQQPLAGKVSASVLFVTPPTRTKAPATRAVTGANAQCV